MERENSPVWDLKSPLLPTTESHDGEPVGVWMDNPKSDDLSLTGVALWGLSRYGEQLVTRIVVNRSGRWLMLVGFQHLLATGMVG